MFTQKCQSFLLTSHGLLFLLLLLLLLLHRSHTLDVEQLCEIRCNIGRGGVLCKCNAFHFAGKRNDETSRYFDDLAAVSGRKYKNPNGDVTISASGSVRPYGDAEKERGDVWRSGRMEGSDVMPEGLFGDGGERSPTGKRSLSSLLKDVLSKQQLINSRRNSKLEAPNWQESSFPFTTGDEEY